MSQTASLLESELVSVLERPSNHADFHGQLLLCDVEMMGDLLARESRCHPNTHEPLPRREAREDSSGYTDLSVVWIASTVPGHELIGSK